MIIDRTYFVGELNIPNVGTPAIGGLVDWFIQKYEPKFMVDILGYELNKAFQAGWVAYTVDQKWTDLIEGVEYTDLAGKLRYWQGFVTFLPSLIGNQSPIANYVYYWFVRNNLSQTATMGEVKTANENATAHNPGLKMVRAWNEISRWVCDLVDYLNAAKVTYPEWESQQIWLMQRKFAPINEMNI